mmetsp:Transcript_37411/g.101318  ORF Transcript_37411/g.101318 Transcript_37411/m.101318 type:complete len:209 (+) Transcript_37411:50-676(+)
MGICNGALVGTDEGAHLVLHARVAHSLVLRVPRDALAGAGACVAHIHAAATAVVVPPGEAELSIAHLAVGLLGVLLPLNHLEGGRRGSGDAANHTLREREWVGANEWRGEGGDRVGRGIGKRAVGWVCRWPHYSTHSTHTPIAHANTTLTSTRTHRPMSVPCLTSSALTAVRAGISPEHAGTDNITFVPVAASGGRAKSKRKPDGWST